MSLPALILGVVGQLCLACFLAMMAIFGGAAIANRDLGGLHGQLFPLFLGLLPLVALVTAGLLIYFHVSDSPLRSYLWHLLPFPFVGLYMLYLYLVLG